jgi:hypothetical protein
VIIALRCETEHSLSLSHSVRQTQTKSQSEKKDAIGAVVMHLLLYFTHTHFTKEGLESGILYSHILTGKAVLSDKAAWGSLALPA